LFDDTPSGKTQPVQFDWLYLSVDSFKDNSGLSRVIRNFNFLPITAAGVLFPLVEQLPAL